MSDKNDALLRAGFMSFWERAVLKQVAPVLREEAMGHLEPGESGTIKSPLDGSKLGRYNLTDPGWAGRVVDRPAVDRWITARYREKCESRSRITDMAEAIRVLRDVRPDLVEDDLYVPDHVADSLVRRSEKAQEPIGFGGELGVDAPPGIEVTPPRPVLRIVLDKDNAVPGYRALWDASVFTGQMLQIEGGQ